MTTIRKTISISSKDKKLQEIIQSVPNYEVSHVIRQLMYDGIKYRKLVENGVINDETVAFLLKNSEKSVKNSENIAKIEQNKQKITKNEEKIQEIEDCSEEIDINDIKLEEIDENDEDLENLLLNNG